MQAAVVRAASTPQHQQQQRFDGPSGETRVLESSSEAAVQPQPATTAAATASASAASTSGRRKLARKRARSEEEQEQEEQRAVAAGSSRSTSTSPTSSRRRRGVNKQPRAVALRDEAEVEVEVEREGSEEGETASPAAAATDEGEGEGLGEGEGDDGATSSSCSGGQTATTLRRRGGGGATTARRKATSGGGARSTSPTSTSSRRRQRVQQQHHQKQLEGAEPPEAVQQEQEEAMKEKEGEEVEREEDNHAAATAGATPPPVVVVEEEEEEEAGEAKREESEAEPDHQPRHGDSGASSAATHEATAGGEGAENEGEEAEEDEEGGGAEVEEEEEKEEVESAEDGGVEDAALDEQESDVADGELPDHVEEAAAKAEEDDEEERMDTGIGSEDDATHDAAGSSAMEVETQSNGAMLVSPTKSEDEASSSPAVATKGVSPRTRAANDAQAAAGPATKKADEKSASPPSQYATRRRTRGMTQEKEKEKTNGDFITGQDEVDQYILGSKSNSASPSKDSQTVGPVLYKPGEEFRGLKKHVGKRLVVHIDAKHITTTNDQVSERQIWGNNGYTADSDLICVLLHTGSLKTISAEPPEYFGIALYMHILPGRDSYIGTKRGIMRSRNWSEHDVTLKLDRFEVLPVKPDDWASAEQVDGATMKTKKKSKKTSTEESVKRKRRRKEANDKQLENGVAVDNKDEAGEANDDAASTTTSRSGGRTRRGRARVGVRSNTKEEQQQPSLTSALLKKEQLAAPAVTTPAPSTSSGPVGIKQEPHLDDMEAEADEAAAEQAPTTTTTTTTNSRVNTRSGRQPPPAAAPKKRVRRRPASGAKTTRSSRQTQQSPTAGAGNWEGGQGVAGSEWDADTMGSRMREDDSTDAPLADESDSDDSVLSGKKRAKIAGNMKLLEKIARLDRWMPLPTDVMRYNLSYEPCYHYTLGMLADRGFESDFWFSTRLRSFTLYLENDSQRFEFSYSGEATQVEPSVDALLGSQALSFLSFFSPTRMPPNTDAATETTCLRPGGQSRKPIRSPKDEALLEAEKHNRIRVAYGHYRWAEVNHPFSMDRAELKRVGVPLPNDSADISVLAAELTWEEVAWGEGSVCVRGTTYPLHSLFWMPRSRTGASDGTAD